MRTPQESSRKFSRETAFFTAAIVFYSAAIVEAQRIYQDIDREAQNAFPSSHSTTYLEQAKSQVSQFKDDLGTAIRDGEFRINDREVVIFTPRAQDGKALQETYQALEDEKKRQEKIYQYRRGRLDEEIKIDLSSPKPARVWGVMGLFGLGTIFLFFSRKSQKPKQKKSQELNL